MSQYLSLLKSMLRPSGKVSFLKSLPQTAAILDVGCGNNSPYNIKKISPGFRYTGIDIQDYNQSRGNDADRYIITTSREFANTIGSLESEFDGVISAHNLEHCEDRVATLKAMVAVVRPGGKLYLSFPCSQTISFPRRAGTLNYYDDSTHRSSPPDVAEVLRIFEESGLDVVKLHNPCQPIFYRILGFLFEPISALRRKVMMGTWDYYGFETVIWGQRPTPR
jgi:SAM-dependent methyltransferase